MTALTVIKTSIGSVSETRFVKVCFCKAVCNLR